MGASSPAAVDAAGAAWRQYTARAARVLSEAQQAKGEAPPLPTGVAELTFKDFFSPVIGDRGLDLSPKLTALHGQRVRIAGYMTREDIRHPGVFLLTPWPTKVSDDGYCVTDELPPATLHVLLPEGTEQERCPYLPGQLFLTGILQVGPAAAPDGRNAIAQLRLDVPLTDAR